MAVHAIGNNVPEAQNVVQNTRSNVYVTPTSAIILLLEEYYFNSTLNFGFAQPQCGGCGQRFLVVFSCKARDVCPACIDRGITQAATNELQQQLRTRGQTAGVVGSSGTNAVHRLLT